MKGIFFMRNLALVKSENWNNIAVDFWQNDEHEIWMTRQQIGQALEYEKPNKALEKLHQRHKERLAELSTTVTLGVVEGKRNIEREMIVYNAKGVYEICRWSRQPKANEFMDWVWDVVEKIRTGEIVRYNIPKDYSSALRALADTEEQKLKLTEENQTLLPQAQGFQLLVKSDGAQNMNDFAKAMNWGRNRLYDFMREQNVFMPNTTTPYQKYVNQECFIVKETYNNGFVFPYTLITPKGIKFIVNLIQKQGVITDLLAKNVKEVAV